MMSLTVGRITIDRYWKGDSMIGRVPGGSAFNVARWFDRAGFESALSATVGDDFPADERIDTSLCTECSESTPVVDIHLTDDEREEETVVNEGQYELRPLPTPSQPFDVVMETSLERPFVRQFERTSASVKAFDPGQMTDAYEPSLLQRGFEEANHVLLSDSEQTMVEKTLDEGPATLCSTYELDSLVVTASESVVIYLPDENLHVPVDRIDAPADTIGAGDALAARYLEGVLNGEGTIERARQAVERASRIVQHVGSLPDFDPRERRF